MIACLIPLQDILYCRYQLNEDDPRFPSVCINIWLVLGVFTLSVAIDHFKTELEIFGNWMRMRSRGVFFQPITKEQLTSEFLLKKSLVQPENLTILKF